MNESPLRRSSRVAPQFQRSYAMAIQLSALTTAQVHEVIELARRKEARNGNRRNTSPVDVYTEAASPELRHLVMVINQLPSPAKNELLTLAWLGMGTIDPDQSSWSELMQAAQDDQINDVPERLALMPRLHEFLYRGMENIG